MENINLTRASVYIIIKKDSGKNYPVGIHSELIYYKNITEFELMCRKFFGPTGFKPLYFDYENIPDVYITENWICPELFPLIRFIAELPVHEQTGFSVWLDTFRPYLGEIRIEDLQRVFQNSFEGCFRSKQHFGEYNAREQLAINPIGSPGFNIEVYTHLLFEERYLFRDGYVFKL